MQFCQNPLAGWMVSRKGNFCKKWIFSASRENPRLGCKIQIDIGRFQAFSKKIKILKYQKFIRTGFTDNLIETGIIHWMHILQGARRKTDQYGDC